MAKIYVIGDTKEVTKKIREPIPLIRRGWKIEMCIIWTGNHSLINDKTCFQKKFPETAFFYLTSDRNPLII